MLPIATSIKPKRTPYANYLLITINILIFIVSIKYAYAPNGQRVMVPRDWTTAFTLYPQQPQIWQFVSYAFLHGGLMHIIGNMFFLFLFGNNVNDKLGNIGYICFYLAGAVFSGLGYTLVSASPVLGASGAVAAVTGAYLVLFPNTTITVIIWFFYDIDVKAMFFIIFKLIFIDNVLLANPAHGIAYNAHLAGYGFGVCASIGLLASGLLKSDFNDLWSMLRQWNRRRRFRDAVSDGFDPYKGHAVRKTVDSVEKPDPNQEAIFELRGQIGQALNNQNPAAAAQLYLKLLDIDASQTLSRQPQLDVANQLMSEGKWPESAQAYHKFLDQYASYGYAEQVHLMLGILYSRYLNQPEKALTHLQTAKENLSDPSQKQMCRQEIDKLQSK